VHPPAEDYQYHADKPHITLVEAFRNMQVEEEEPLENGDFDHEVFCQLGVESPFHTQLPFFIPSMLRL